MPKVFRFVNKDGESLEAPGRQTAALNELTQLRANEVQEHMKEQGQVKFFSARNQSHAQYVPGTRVLRKNPIGKVNRSEANINQATRNLKKRVLNADDRAIEFILCKLMALEEGELLSNAELNVLFSKRGTFFGRSDLPREVLDKLMNQGIDEDEKESVLELYDEENVRKPLQCAREGIPTNFPTDPDFVRNLAEEEAKNAAKAAAASSGRRRPVSLASHGGASRKKKTNKRKRTTRKH